MSDLKTQVHSSLTSKPLSPESGSQNIWLRFQTLAVYHPLFSSDEENRLAVWKTPQKVHWQSEQVESKKQESVPIK